MLAAGASTRMGQPKALLSIGEETVLEWLVERIEKAGLSPVVVTRQELAFDCLSRLAGRPVVINPNPEAGRTGSLQVGLAHVLDAIGAKKRFGVIIAPVDRPGFSDETLARLVAAEGCVKPAMGGRGGHPIRLTEAEVGAIMAASGSTPLNELIQPAHFEVADPHLHFNLDTPADAEALQGLVN